MKNNILKKVKEVIKTVEPSAEIFLYGSQARKEHTEQSDWDFLILVEGTVDTARVDRIRHILYEIEWSTGEILSSIIRNREEWYNPKFKFVPLHVNIAKEGILI